MRVDGIRIRKEKVADSKLTGYVWTGPSLTINLVSRVFPFEIGRGEKCPANEAVSWFPCCTRKKKEKKGEIL